MLLLRYGRVWWHLLLTLLWRVSLHHGKRACCISLLHETLLRLMLLVPAAHALVRCGYLWLVWQVSRGLDHERGWMMIAALVMTGWVWRASHSWLGSPVISDDHLLIARRLLLLLVLLHCDLWLILTTTRRILLLIQQDTSLHGINGTYKHACNFLLQSIASWGHLVCHLNCLLLTWTSDVWLLLVVGSLGVGIGISRIHDAILWPLWVHFLVMRTHLEDLFNLEVIFGATLSCGSRLVDRISIVLHGVGQWSAVSHGKRNFWLCTSLLYFEVWRDLCDVVIKLRVLGCQVLCLDPIDLLLVAEVGSTVSNLTTSVAACILRLIYAVIVANIYCAVGKTLGMRWYCALTFLKTSCTARVVWILILRWIKYASNTALDHFVPRDLLSIDIDGVVGWIRRLMCALLADCHSSVRWKHQVVLLDLGVWVLLRNCIVWILACVFRANYLTLRCHNATVTQDIPIVIYLCLGSYSLLARLSRWQSMMDWAPLTTIIWILSVVLRAAWIDKLLGHVVKVYFARAVLRFSPVCLGLCQHLVALWHRVALMVSLMWHLTIDCHVFTHHGSIVIIIKVGNRSLIKRLFLLLFYCWLGREFLFASILLAWHFVFTGLFLSGVVNFCLSLLYALFLMILSWSLFNSLLKHGRWWRAVEHSDFQSLRFTRLVHQFHLTHRHLRAAALRYYLSSFWVDQSHSIWMSELHGLWL